MNCKHCNRPNRETARFCKWCGAAMDVAANNVLPEIIGMDGVKDQLTEIVALQQVLAKRAKALISIAHPEDREALERAACERFGYSFLRLKG